MEERLGLVLKLAITQIPRSKQWLDIAFFNPKIRKQELIKCMTACLLEKPLTSYYKWNSRAQLQAQRVSRRNLQPDHNRCHPIWCSCWATKRDSVKSFYPKIPPLICRQMTGEDAYEVKTDVWSHKLEISTNSWVCLRTEKTKKMSDSTHWIHDREATTVPLPISLSPHFHAHTMELLVNPMGTILPRTSRVLLLGVLEFKVR